MLQMGQFICWKRAAAIFRPPPAGKAWVKLGSWSCLAWCRVFHWNHNDPLNWRMYLPKMKDSLQSPMVFQEWRFTLSNWTMMAVASLVFEDAREVQPLDWVLHFKYQCLQSLGSPNCPGLIEKGIPSDIFRGLSIGNISNFPSGACVQGFEKTHFIGSCGKV